MPTVSIKSDVSEDDVVSAIKGQLGAGYVVEAKEGDKERISIERRRRPDRRC